MYTFKYYVYIITNVTRSKTGTQRVSPENLERVKKIGQFGESFDDVIGRVLDFWEEQKEKEVKQ